MAKEIVTKDFFGRLVTGPLKDEKPVLGSLLADGWEIIQQEASLREGSFAIWAWRSGENTEDLSDKS